MKYFDYITRFFSQKDIMLKLVHGRQCFDLLTYWTCVEHKSQTICPRPQLCLVSFAATSIYLQLYL